MKLREYIEELNTFVEQNPDALDMTIVASSDDEGNNYSEVCYTPCKGFYKKGDFISSSDFYDNEYGEWEFNAVCIN